jgi:hypothetical protein
MPAFGLLALNHFPLFACIVGIHYFRTTSTYMYFVLLVLAVAQGTQPYEPEPQ